MTQIYRGRPIYLVKSIFVLKLFFNKKVSYFVHLLSLILGHYGIIICTWYILQQRSMQPPYRWRAYIKTIAVNTNFSNKGGRARKRVGIVDN